jgi:hypothetical protein
MTNTRNIAYDAIITVFYVGFFAAMLCVSLTLLAHHAFEVPVGYSLSSMATVNLLGWLALPLFPRLYRWLTGCPFTWRSNAVLDGRIEA